MDVSLDLVRVFLAVAQTGGFTAAARRLGSSKGQVSKEVARLEHALGSPLFVRTTRQVVLSEEGRRLQDRVLPLVAALEHVLRDGHDDAPAGRLRITVPPDYLQAAFAPVLAAFARRHPRVEIDLIADNQVRDIVAEGIDVAVRLGWLRDSTMRATRIGAFSLRLVAAPAYLAQHGVPEHPMELEARAWIGLGALDDPGRFTFTQAGGVSHTTHLRSRYQANTIDAVLALARGGLGVTIAADFAVREDLARGTLQTVLPQWQAPQGGIYLVWARAAREPARVRALISFLKASALLPVA